jgi:hypothetical protein
LTSAGVLEFVHEELLNTVVQEKLQVTRGILAQGSERGLFQPHEVEYVLLPTSRFVCGYCAGDQYDQIGQSIYVGQRYILPGKILQVRKQTG